MALGTRLSANSQDPATVGVYTYSSADTTPFTGSFYINNPSPVLAVFARAGSPAAPNINVGITIGVTSVGSNGINVITTTNCFLQGANQYITYTSTGASNSVLYTCPSVPVNSFGLIALPILTFTLSYTGTTIATVSGPSTTTNSGTIVNLSTFVVAFQSGPVPSRTPGQLTQRRDFKPWLKQATREQVVKRFEQKEKAKRDAAAATSSFKRRVVSAERRLPRRPASQVRSFPLRYPSLELLD